MSRINLSVSVDDDHINRISEVVQNLKKAGMKVENLLDQLGIVTGWCESEKVAKVSQVEGVLDVESERTVQLAPPTSYIQ
ncbi:MAG: hypothetical protein WA919_01535 [Coleofasciculaceae cyanobacterium]